MKISNAENNVLGAGGLGAVSTFKISTTAHAFKMLSSGLYSDKIGAVLREIGCNAHDAHIAGGIAHKPIEVKLPNGIDNQFWIKDFGPGLSHDDVMGLYTTYFASTKQDSNDFTGGFGLGSKSPFSYTDSFVIVSCHGGEEMTFTAHIGNDGAPKIALMNRVPTTETGVKISFPVPGNDFSDFATKAQNIFQYFTPLPTILGGDDIQPAEYAADYGRYAILKSASANRSGYGTVYIQMGNVMYPAVINSTMMNTAANTGIGRVFLEAFSYARGFVLRMPIGSVAVAASRESLQFDVDTVKVIQNELKAIALVVCKELEKAYYDIKTWEDRCNFTTKYHTLSQGLHITGDLLQAAGIAQAQAVHDACRSSYHIIGTGKMPADLEMYTSSLYGGKVMRKSTASQNNQHIQIAFNEKTVIVAGIATQAVQRVRKLMMDGKAEQVIAIYPQIGKTVTQADISKVVATVEKATNITKIIDIATLDRPPVTRSKHPKVPRGQFPDRPVCTSADMDVLVNASTIPAGNRVYLKAKVYTRWGNIRPVYFLDDTGIEHGAYELRNLLQPIQIINKFTPIVLPVFVTPGNFKAMRMEKNPDWEPYLVYLKRTLLSQTVLDSLRKKAKDYVPRVELDDVVHTPLECMVHVKKYHPAVYQGITPILRKVSVHDEIEKVYNVSTAPKATQSVKIPELISAYRETLRKLSVPMTDIPDLDKSESVVNTKLSGKFRNLNSSFIKSIADLSPNACITILTEIFS